MWKLLTFNKSIYVVKKYEEAVSANSINSRVQRDKKYQNFASLFIFSASSSIHAYRSCCALVPGPNKNELLFRQVMRTNKLMIHIYYQELFWIFIMTFDMSSNSKFWFSSNIFWTFWYRLSWGTWHMHWCPIMSSANSQFV